MLVSVVDYDPPTHYMCEYTNCVLEKAKEKSWQVHVLSGLNAVRSNAISRLSKNNYCQADENRPL